MQFANACQLACRVEAGFDFGDSGLVCNRRGCLCGVAGKHENAEAGIASFGECGYGRCRIRTKHVAGIEIAGRDIVERHPQTGHAGFRGWDFCRKRNAEIMK